MPFQFFRLSRHSGDGVFVCLIFAATFLPLCWLFALLRGLSYRQMIAYLRQMCLKSFLTLLLRLEDHLYLLRAWGILLWETLWALLSCVHFLYRYWSYWLFCFFWLWNLWPFNTCVPRKVTKLWAISKVNLRCFMWAIAYVKKFHHLIFCPVKYNKAVISIWSNREKESSWHVWISTKYIVWSDTF